MKQESKLKTQVVRALFPRSWLFAPALFACAGARLDPEKNQALTFDTTSPSDAGVPTTAQPLVKKAAPSQLASEAGNGEPTAAPGNPSPPAEPIRCTQDPPDPKPTSTRDWFALEFSYVDAAAKLRSARRVQTPRPRDSARVVGRYAVELWIGCELIDRVRFSFPLQAAELPPKTGTRRALHEQPSLTARAELTATVLVPSSDRATRAELVDRSAGTRVALAWPPNLKGETSDNGLPAQGNRTGTGIGQ
jgi:hypothetical protein